MAKQDRSARSAPRSASLRVVFLAQSEQDTRQRAARLERAGHRLDWRHVEDEVGFRESLKVPPHLIVADPLLPGFPPEKALAILRATVPAAHFILYANGSGAPAGDHETAGAVLLCPSDEALPEVVLSALGPQPSHRSGVLPADVRDEFLDLAIEGIVRQELDGSLSYVNRAAAEMLGYATTELLGLPWHRIIPEDQRHLVEEADQRRAKGVSDRYPLELLRREGTRLKVLVSGTPRFVDGHYDGTLAVFTDISGLHRTEQALRQSNATLNALIQASPVAIATLDSFGQVRIWNPAAERVFGYRADEVIGKPLPTVPPEAQAEHRALRARVFSGDWLEGVEVIRRHKDGRPLTIRLYTAPMRDPQGEVTGILGLMVDVTEEKKAAAALAESEVKFRTLAEESPNIIFINRRGRVLYANKKSSEVMGYERHEFAAPDFDFLQLLAPESRGLAQENFRRHMAGEEVPPTPYTLITRDGKRVEGLHNTRLIDYGGEPAILGIITDVTQQKRDEQALRKSEAMLSESQRVAAVGHYDFDVATGTWTSSEMLDEIFGIEADHPKTVDSWLDIVQADHRAEMYAYLRDSVLKEKKAFDREYPMVRVNDGSMRWVHGLGRLQFDAAGQPARMFGVIQDVTEKKQAEQALARRAAQFEVLAEIGAQITAVAELDELLDRTAALVQQRLGYEHVGVFLTAEDGALVQQAKAGPFARHYPSGHRVQANRGLVGAAFTDGIPILANDVEQDRRYVNYYPDRVPTRAELCVPIRSGGRPVGVLDVQARAPGAFSETDVQMLGILSDQLGAAIANTGLVEAVRANEVRYRDLTENAAVGIYRTTPDGRILFANPAVVRMLGFDSFEALAERNLESEGFQPEYSRQDFKDRLEREGSIVGLESAWRRRDGTTIYVRESARVVRDDRSRSLYYEGTVEDVTDRKLAEQSLERHSLELQTLYESSLETIAHHDLEGLLRAVVERAATLIGSNRGGMYLLAPDGESLTLVVSHNYERDYTGAVLRLGEGVSGKVAQTGEVVALTDYQAFEGKASAFRGITTRRLLAVPLRVGESVIGVLNVADDTVGGFQDEEIRLVQLFADQAALAVENARLLKAERERTEQLERARGLVEALSNMAAEAEHAQEADEVMRVLGRQLQGMGLQAWIALLDPETGELAIRYSSIQPALLTKAADILGRPLRGMRIVRSSSFVFDRILDQRQGMAVPVEEVVRAAAPGMPRLVADGLMRLIQVAPDTPSLCLPLAVDERVLGGLMIIGAGLREQDLPAFSIFAGQVAGVMEKTRLLEETRRRAAYLEGITGVSTALRAAGDRADMVPIILDQLRSLLSADAAALEWLGSRPEEIITELGLGAWKSWTGRAWPTTLGVRNVVLRSRRRLLSGNPATDPLFARDRRLGTLPTKACVPLIVQEEPIGLIWVGRKASFSEVENAILTAVAELAANALHRAGVMETLEERVRERTRELEQANDRLQELDQLKGRFVSNVSHELRTPITNIQLYLDLLRRPAREDRREEYLTTLEGQSRRLGRLIEDLLALSRLDAGMIRLNLEAHLLDGLIAEVVAEQLARAETKNVGLIHEPHAECPPAWVSREQMNQVLTNLVANAVAYTPAGGRVVVETRRGGPEKGLVGARVWNDGPPIPAEDMPHLFERFFRGQTGLASGEPGTGLGLAICREIVERHDGWIEVDSSPKAGTAFTIWLPTVVG